MQLCSCACAYSAAGSSARLQVVAVVFHSSVQLRGPCLTILGCADGFGNTLLYLFVVIIYKKQTWRTSTTAAEPRGPCLTSLGCANGFGNTLLCLFFIISYKEHTWRTSTTAAEPRGPCLTSLGCANGLSNTLQICLL